MDLLKLHRWAGSPGEHLCVEHTATRTWITASVRPFSRRWRTRWLQEDTKRLGMIPSLSTIAGWIKKGRGRSNDRLMLTWLLFRSPDGKLQPDAKRFPSGIPALADYVHKLGLKFGIYGDIGK